MNDEAEEEKEIEEKNKTKKILNGNLRQKRYVIES